MVLEDLSLGVVSDVPDVHEAAKVESLRAKLCHDANETPVYGRDLD